MFANTGMSFWLGAKTPKNWFDVSAFLCVGPCQIRAFSSSVRVSSVLIVPGGKEITAVGTLSRA